MSRRYWFRRFAAPALGLLFLAAALPVWAGNSGFRQGAVGGVLVDAEGVVSNAELDDLGQLRQLRLQTTEPVPANLQKPVKLRRVSLRGLEAAIAERKSKMLVPLLSDEMYFLGGLTRIQYVFVYPEQKDIVIAGPAEGWKVDDRGVVIGTSTGQPLLQLDHLIVALRTAEAARKAPISCSIDPTPEGLRRFQAFMKTQKELSEATLAGIEHALGLQTITINGVSENTDFARVLVAADFRLKRLGMGFDRSPVKNMPSYLQLVTVAAAKSATPRWWLAPNYDAMLKDPEGLAWELRGQGVKCLTEDSLFTAEGGRQQTGKSSAAAQRWADSMTQNYNELCAAETIFGELRNVMDMAVVSALIFKEHLLEKTEYQLPILMDPLQVAIHDFPAPRQVNSKANALKKGRNWIISASGGIEINSWEVAHKTETSADLAALRQPKPATAKSWYWE